MYSIREPEPMPVTIIRPHPFADKKVYKAFPKPGQTYADVFDSLTQYPMYGCSLVLPVRIYPQYGHENNEVQYWVEAIGRLVVIKPYRHYTDWGLWDYTMPKPEELAETFRLIRKRTQKEIRDLLANVKPLDPLSWFINQRDSWFFYQKRVVDMHWGLDKVRNFRLNFILEVISTCSDILNYVHTQLYDPCWNNSRCGLLSTCQLNPSHRKTN